MFKSQLLCLFIKKAAQFGLNASVGKRLVPGGKVGHELIRAVPDIVHRIAIFIETGEFALGIRHAKLQIGFMR